ncbi:MAG: hypothetical protein LAT68_03600 [Cyclobacteriaceae bacterium]|nr:hypothetical protein [Cyclobacteriaceae bacterium]MCH8515394.1 hypothetical protein [Cyclobacteriaceae bacterium]
MNWDEDYRDPQVAAFEERDFLWRPVRVALHRHSLRVLRKGETSKIYLPHLKLSLQKKENLFSKIVGALFAISGALMIFSSGQYPWLSILLFFGGAFTYYIGYQGYDVLVVKQDELNEKQLFFTASQSKIKALYRLLEGYQVQYERNVGRNFFLYASTVDSQHWSVTHPKTKPYRLDFFQLNHPFEIRFDSEGSEMVLSPHPEDIKKLVEANAY